MDVKVLAKKWGYYVEGDIIPNMPEATANALVKNKLVEIVGEETEVKPKKTTKK